MKKETNSVYIKTIDNVIKTISSNISVEDYFSFNSEKKVTSQYLILKLIGKSVSISKNQQDTFKSLIGNIMNRCEDTENYELAEVCKDIRNNYDSLFEMITTGLKTKRTIKTNKPND